MVKCCIIGCNSSSKHTLIQGVRLHRFPTKNQALRRSWIRFALLSGTRLSKLDITDRNNRRICSHHFVDMNRDANPEPSVLPQGRQLEQPPAGSSEALYITDMEMEDQRESGGSYTFPTDGALNLEAFIDAKLAELDVATLFEKATEKLDVRLRQQERKTREVNQIFTHCENQLKQFKHNIEMDQGIMDKMEMEAATGADADSDDDVQIVTTGYEPHLVKRHPQQRTSPYQQRFPGPRAGIPQGMQQNFTMRSGTLIRHPSQQASGGVRQQFMARPVGQQFPRPPNPASRFSVPQVPGPRPLGSNKSLQGGPRMPGEAPMTVTQRRPNTTMNAPPTKHADLVVGMKMFGKKFNDIWYKGTLVEIHDKDKPRSEWRYRIKFDSKGLKVLPGRGIAFIESPTDTLPVGSRVVALYKDEDSSANTAHYAGIVSESPSLRNSQRYLIFFDDGYAQYCASNEIHKVYEQSRNVWEDIHPDSQEFIKSYLKQYPERPMVRLQSNQIIKTEWNGRWWTARVLVTDASLVKMYFDADKRVEWIYRGSTRLEPLYTELTNAEISKASGKGHRRHNLGMKSNKKPIVEYLRGTDEDFMRRKQPLQNKIQPPPPQAAPPMQMQRSLSADSVSTVASSINKKRHVARKSTGKPQPEIAERAERVERPMMERRQFQTSSISRHSLGSSRDMIQDRLTSEFIAELNEGEGLGERMAIDTGWKDIVRKTYYPHRCNPKCLEGTELDPGKFRGYNPLIIPMLCGWERQISKQKNTGKRAVFYRGPCARRMRSLTETEYYLKETDAMITIDMFCYDVMLHTHSEFVPIKTFCDIKDLSYGKETVRISCVNGIDRQYPDYVEYSNQRIPAEGVHLNLDPDFLVGCNCTDNCGDPETCSCAKLTLEASRVIPGPKPETLGYQYRRLKEPITSGIYECNQRCKCDARCCNRVAQNGLQLRLQVFKTEKRGWGLRSLDDIPAGGFICVYAGQLLTEQGANEDGQQYGDEYLAELDYIEVVERSKEGYESDVDINIDDEGIEQDRSRSGDDDEDEAGDNYHGHSDSDSTFSGEKYLTSINLTGTPERKSNRKRTKKVQDGEKDKGEKKSTKIVIKRGADQDKSWSVKVKSPQAKTKEWVDSIPDPPAPMTIVISDEEDSSGSKAEKSKVTDKPDVKSDTGDDSKGDTKPESENQESDKSEVKDENKEKGEKSAKEESDEKKDSDLDSCGEKKLEKPKTTSPSKVTLNLKSSFMSEVHIDEASIDPTRRPIRVPRIRERGIGCTNSDKDKDSTEAKAESGEPTASSSKPHSGGETQKKESNDSSDSSQDGSKKKEKEKTTKGADKDEASNNSKGGSGEGSDKSNKQSRNRLSRFSGLPDPKSQQVISPIKIKLMKEAAEKKAEAAAKKKEKKQAAAMEEEEDHGFKTRLFYNNEDFCYVMDAKSMGNLGRYLNHNCAPNVFVQNVFVDTHDMRFPWVAFFAGQYIRAGTELTWDYNYEVGSVPGKVLYCYCGAAECRGRLL